jgi:Fe(3+) dicitrate transport protein
MKTLIKFLLLLSIYPTFSFSQQKIIQKDTATVQALNNVTVTAFLNQGLAQPLPPVVDMYIFAGKKTTEIQLDASNANLAGGVARQAFAQIPGLNIWEMDGAGTQVNIGSRSTDTHRSIEMNMRQNGYNTNSDMFGYPENHYTIPMEAIDHIQYVRGSAALQFGPQFGGMMDYIIKHGDSTKPLSLESNQTKGSNNFYNSFNAIGGTVGKINYYAYYDNRSGDGWRPNANFNYHAYYANIEYHFNAKGSMSLQFSRMDYVQKIAGGLDDAQFYQNARQSFRSRNYFNPEINIPALTFKYRFSSNTQMEVTSHLLFGQRNSVQFINTPNIADTINASLGTYNPRQVDRDYYNGFTTEARILHHYKLGNMQNTIAAGVRYFSETTKRQQKGTGTAGSDFDLGLTKGYNINLNLHTNNYAAFAENIFQVTPRFSITPGVRYEIINSTVGGVIVNGIYQISYKGNRSFPLFGIGTQYQVSQTMQLYGNITQAYRPYIYANVTPADQIGVIDPNLKDSKGYDIDLGYRGHFKDLVNFDISAFLLYYGNRVGQLTLKNETGNGTYLYNTNVGNSLAKGVEAYIDASIWKVLTGKRTVFDVKLFTSLAYDHARYTTGMINNGGINVSLAGNHVEGTPDWINRMGLKLIYSNVSTSLQYSYVSSGFSDANNTVFVNTGLAGVVPAYHVWDWVLNYNFLKQYHFSAGINNLTDATYFTRRINMYPGPGILPADGRTVYISLGVRL